MRPRTRPRPLRRARSRAAGGGPQRHVRSHGSGARPGHPGRPAPHRLALPARHLRRDLGCSLAPPPLRRRRLPRAPTAPRPAAPPRSPVHLRVVRGGHRLARLAPPPPPAHPPAAPPPPRALRPDEHSSSSRRPLRRHERPYSCATRQSCRTHTHRVVSARSRPRAGAEPTAAPRPPRRALVLREPAAASKPGVEPQPAREPDQAAQLLTWWLSLLTLRG